MSGNFSELLLSRFPEDLSQPFLMLKQGQISYDALRQGAGRLASLLHQKGVRPGDRVAVQAPKSPEVVMLYLGTLMAGAVYLPLNPSYTRHEVAYFIDDAEPALFITDVAKLALEAEPLEPLQTPVPRLESDLAAIVYTSGTTGRSKGAMISHGALASNALALHQAWGFRPGDVLLHVLPIFHIHGLFIALNTALLNGGPLIWRSTFDVDDVLAALCEATVMMGVPTYYSRLLAHEGFAKTSAQRMRLFVSGSAPLHPATFEAFEQKTGHRILERYGMSEAGVITSNPLEGERIPGCVGFPLPGVQLRIQGGEVGVIEIKGPSVCSGYWRMEEKTREEFTSDGFFKTGDVGRIDTQGRVWISDRAKDLIISGGLNVYPREVELVLDAFEGVTESAVIAVPHPDFGEAVVAVVAGKGSEQDLIAAARERLAAFKAPKRIFFVDELPRNTMGKVQKAALRRTFENTFS